MVLSFAGAIVVIFLLSDSFMQIANDLNSITNDIPNSIAYIKLMLKILCIVITAQIVSQVCKDNGEGTLSLACEVCAKIVVVVLILPMFEALISILNGLVKWKDL